MLGCHEWSRLHLRLPLAKFRYGSEKCSRLTSILVEGWVLGHACTVSFSWRTFCFDMVTRKSKVSEMDFWTWFDRLKVLLLYTKAQHVLVGLYSNGVEVQLLLLISLCLFVCESVCASVLFLAMITHWTCLWSKFLKKSGCRGWLNCCGSVVSALGTTDFPWWLIGKQV